MLGWLEGWLRRRRMRERLAAARAQARVGQWFELGSSGRIVNESRDPGHVTIGDHVFVDGRVHTSPRGRIELGDYCYISEGAVLAAADSIRIGHHVGIAHHTYVVDNNNHPTEPEARLRHRERVAPGGEGYPTVGSAWELSDKAPIVIGNNVWIGMFCFIGKGVTIGDGAIVARQSVVTHDVEPYTVVAGNPARVVKRLDPPAAGRSEPPYAIRDQLR